ncbi:MAG: RluA family pseudouridine synthase [Dehalococcoidia bacterium]|nr:RluA family pseudouridine synthase [Dehalococcoidia bacterium]
MMNSRVLTVSEPGERLDTWVASSCPEISRAEARRLIEAGLVRVGGRTVRGSRRLAAGDVVEIDAPEPAQTGLQALGLPLVILYEDADVVVVDKPAGVTVHASPGHHDDTLVNVLLAHYPEIGSLSELRPGIVHRLDKDTSGVMMVARNAAAEQELARQIKDREVEKTYLAIVIGRVAPAEGVVEAPLGRHPRDRKRRAIVEGGREARTRYRVLTQGPAAALLEVGLETGRTHQIRVHLAAIGYPVLGDPIYGRRSEAIARQALHSLRLAFRQPQTGELVVVGVEAPEDFRRALDAMGLCVPDSR